MLINHWSLVLRYFVAAVMKIISMCVMEDSQSNTEKLIEIKNKAGNVREDSACFAATKSDLH